MVRLVGTEVVVAKGESLPPLELGVDTEGASKLNTVVQLEEHNNHLQCTKPVAQGATFD